MERHNIETDCIWSVLQKVGTSFFTRIKVVSAQNHLVCDLTMVLSVKDFLALPFSSF